MGRSRIPVKADTVTVLGYKWKETDRAWAGLDFSRAEPRTQSTLMLMICGAQEAPTDIHLNVPFCHPDDQTGAPDDFDCIYRVRPRVKVGGKHDGATIKSISFERWDGQWFIAIEH